MSALLNTYEHRLDAVLQFAEGRTGEGPSWLRELRRRSLAAFREQGLPTPRQEEWKYTPLRAVAETAWASAEPGPATFDFPLPFSVEGSIRIVLVNGQFDRNLSEIPTDSALQIHSLFSALSDAPELVEQQIGSLVATSDFPFAALNSCLFHDGAVIHIRGEVERVVELIHVSFGSGQVLAPRVLIVAEPNSKARITETYVSAPDAGNLVIPVTEARIAEGAEIEHVRVQDEATTSHHVGLWEARQQADSTYLAYNVAYGGSLGRLDQNIFIAGERCTTRLDGVAVARGAQLLDNHTKLDHAVPNCNSFEVYKQIVGDQAIIVFNGKIMVHQDAQKTDAKQTNQALLLSPDATINSKPQLEIFADDVKCTHGATVGQLEELPLFYLMSRGMPRSQAEGILVYAFAAEVLELISIPEVRERLETRLFEILS